VMTGQGQVAGLGSVPVQHGGHLALAAAAAGSALAELVTSLGGDLYLGHGASLLVSTCYAGTKCSRERSPVRIEAVRGAACPPARRGAACPPARPGAACPPARRDAACPPARRRPPPRPRRRRPGRPPARPRARSRSRPAGKARRVHR